MRKRVLFLLMVIACSSAKGQSQQLRLTVGDAEKLFQDNNLELVANRFNVDAAEAKVVQSRLFENPSITIEHNIYNRTNGKYFDFSKEGESTVEIEQLIYIAHQRDSRIRLERMNKEVAVRQLELTMHVLKNEVDRQFFNLYYSLNEVKIYHTAIEQLQKIVEILKVQVEKGNVSLAEKSRISALLLSLQQESNQRQDEALEYQAALKVLLGIRQDIELLPEVDETSLAASPLDKIDLQDLIVRIEERPDLKLASSACGVAYADIKVQKSDAFPKVSVHGFYDKHGPICDDYFGLRFSFTLPVFNRNQGNIRAAKAAYEGAQTNYRNQELNAVSSLTSTYYKMLNAWKLYKTSDMEISGDWQKIMEGVNDNFIKRNISLLEYVDYYQTYKETIMNINELARKSWLGMIDLNREAGFDAIKL
ncbi:TolC family protein [Parabacteroides sp. APC149_11_2_Y6]